MYCGDETGAFVGDIGSHTARFGYGGDDCPKVVIPSAVYHHRRWSAEENAKRVVVGKRDMYGNLRPCAVKKNYSAPVSLMRVPPDSCFIDEDGDLGFVPIYSSLNFNHRRKENNTIYNGTIEDIDAWAALWEYSYRSLCVRGKGKHTMGYKYPQPEPTSRPEVAEESFGSRSLFPKRMIMQSPIDVPIDHPLLAVDSTCSGEMSTKEQENQRAAMLETLFESLSAPAGYIAPSAMLSSFAHGRQTSLVIDIGHSGSKITPVVDGHCLNHGRVSSKRGGLWLGAVQKSVLEGIWEDTTGTSSKWNGWGGFIEGPGSPPCRQKRISPRYLLHYTFSSNKYSESRIKALKQSSFHSMAMHDVMFEMMTSSHVVSLERSKELLAPFYGYGNEDDLGDNDVNMDVDIGADEDDDDDDDGPLYLLPDGTRVDLAKSKAGRDLCRLPELLFSDTLSPYCSHYPNDSMLPLQKLVHKSLTQLLDADLRKELSSNIILTGGASLFPGLEKRLSVELGEALPGSYKYKVTASKDSVEKRYSAWIGGSILSSLGSFQQLWLSKREYEECGSVLSLQRFKN